MSTRFPTGMSSEGAREEKVLLNGMEVIFTERVPLVPVQVEHDRRQERDADRRSR